MPEPVVHRSAPPNRPALLGAACPPGIGRRRPSRSRPRRVGWRYLSFRTAALADGETIDAGTSGTGSRRRRHRGWRRAASSPGQVIGAIDLPGRTLALRRPALGGLPAGRDTGQGRRAPGWLGRRRACRRRHRRGAAIRVVAPLADCPVRHRAGRRRDRDPRRRQRDPPDQPDRRRPTRRPIASRSSRS